MTEPSQPQVPLTEAVRQIFLERTSGLIEVAPGDGEDGGKRRLFFVDGELHLPDVNPLAHRLAPLVERGDGDSRDELRSLMARIAHLLLGWQRSAYSVYEGRQALPAELVGPLPTALVLMEWAVAGRGEAELMEALGGGGARLVAAGGGVPTKLAEALEPREALLLSRLDEPVALSDLVRQAGDQGAAELRRLARLRAAGLVQRDRGPIIADERAAAVPPEVMRRLSTRVESELEARPLELDPAEHRESLRRLLAESGGLTHYELLGLTEDARNEEVHAAYDRLARLVHPYHARRIALQGREPALWLLFERATDAYLTLSDPNLRRRYDRKVGTREPQPSPEARRREAQRLAESYYRRSALLLDEEDYHFAVELLKQAVLADPRPEYYARLAEAQAKNPNWLRQAVDSYHKALELGYPDPGVWSALGRLYEDLGNAPRARQNYRKALERRPEDSTAEEGLARLAATETPKRRGFFGLFTGRKR